MFILQDGTCNGLQHYAALGGDVAGAIAVNLQNCAGQDKPQDVYAGEDFFACSMLFLFVDLLFPFRVYFEGSWLTIDLQWCVRW